MLVSLSSYAHIQLQILCSFSLTTLVIMVYKLPLPHWPYTYTIILPTWSLQSSNLATTAAPQTSLIVICSHLNLKTITAIVQLITQSCGRAIFLQLKYRRKVWTFINIYQLAGENNWLVSGYLLCISASIIVSFEQRRDGYDTGTRYTRVKDSLQTVWLNFYLYSSNVT